MTDLQSFYHSSTQPKGGNIVAAVMGSSGSTFAVVTAGRVASIYTLGQQEPTAMFTDFSSDATVILFSHDESLLALGTLGGSIYIYDISSKTCIWKFSAHKSYVTAIAFTHSGMFLASGSVDGSVNIWDIHKKEKLQDITNCNAQPIVSVNGPKSSSRLTSIAPDPAVTALAFPSSGIFLFIGGITGRILVWNTISLAFVRELMSTSRSGGDDLATSNLNVNSASALSSGQLLQMTKLSIKHIIAHDEQKIIAACDGEKVTYWDIGDFAEISKENKAGGCECSFFMNDPMVSLVFHSRGMICVDYEADQGQDLILSSVPVNLDNLFSIAIRRKARFPQIVMLLLEQVTVPSVSIWVINLKNVEPFKTRYASLLNKDGDTTIKKSSATASTTSIQPKAASKQPKPSKQSVPGLQDGSDIETAFRKDMSNDISGAIDAISTSAVYSVFDPSRIPRKTGDTDEMLSVLLGHTEIMESMERKCIIVGIFTNLWHDGKIKAAIETLVQEKDVRVICDVLKKIDARNGISISDVAPLLSYFCAAIQHVVTSRDPSITSIHNATDSMSLSVNYAKIFSQIVFNTFQAYEQADGNDFALADRYAHCFKFYEGMCSIRKFCDEVCLRSNNSKLKANAKSAAGALRDLRFVG